MLSDPAWKREGGGFGLWVTQGYVAGTAVRTSEHDWHISVPSRRRARFICRQPPPCPCPGGGMHHWQPWEKPCVPPMHLAYLAPHTRRCLALALWTRC